MPAKPSGEIKTKIVRQTQKNGDIYVLERKIKYDPEVKYNRVLSTKLISKIPKGETIPVATRPKRSKNSKSTEKTEIVSARRNHVGMMDIIDHIGSVSGIDDAVYASTDTETAQKIISLARYLLATNGQSLPGIQSWQYNHPLPYEDGISEDVYHNLFVQIGFEIVTSELEHTRAYLSVEQTLYKNTLFVDYDTPHTFFRMPPLTLQPIVENSVKHGRDPYIGAFHISIRTKKTDSGSEIVIADDGRGFDPDETKEPGIALKNIRQRLEMMCGGSLAITPGDGAGTVVTITIPDIRFSLPPFRDYLRFLLPPFRDYL